MKRMSPSNGERASVMVDSNWNIVIVFEMLVRMKSFLAYSFQIYTFFPSILVTYSFCSLWSFTVKKLFGFFGS